MKVFLFCLSAAALLGAGPGRAQLAAPNDTGVTTGHVHLNVRSIDAGRKFWLAMGGTPAALGKIEGIRFPGVVILLRQAEPGGGSAGTVVNHVGFRVPDVEAAATRWKQAGLKVEPGRNWPRQAFVFNAEELRIEILEDKAMREPIASHHIHFFVPEASVAELKAWYVKMFGATPSTRGQNESADVPGENLTFSKSDVATVATRGRALDHIGFEVKNLEAFAKKLEASGIKFDRPFGQLFPGLSIAFLTDPWGTYIELTEGLDKM